jgi:hypothetical protein
MPVWPPHKCFLVVEVDGSFFIDHVFPFGLATAGGVQGNVTDATVDILHSMELGSIKKWVDDHLFFRYATGGGTLLAVSCMVCTPYHDIYDKEYRRR